MSPIGFLLKIRKDFPTVSHPGRDRPSLQGLVLRVAVRPEGHGLLMCWVLGI